MSLTQTQVEWLEERFNRIELQVKNIEALLQKKIKIAEVIDVTKNSYKVLQVDAILETPDGLIIRVTE
jgi:hypothetical protein